MNIGSSCIRKVKTIIEVKTDVLTKDFFALLADAVETIVQARELHLIEIQVIDGEKIVLSLDDKLLKVPKNTRRKVLLANVFNQIFINTAKKCQKNTM